MTYWFDPPRSGRVYVLGSGRCLFCQWRSEGTSVHMHDIDPEEAE